MEPLMHKRMTIALAALTFAAACSKDPTGASTNELMLAQDAQVLADNAAASPAGSATYDGWFRRLLDTLRTTDNAAARMDIDSAHVYRDSAWAAFQRGDTASARAVDRKSTRLNSSHRCISYAVFCLKK